MRLRFPVILLVVSVGIASPVGACPYCDSDIGRHVAAGIFNSEFGYNVMLTLLPLLINHHILHIHHVTETANHLTWDLAFLGSGVALILVGVQMIHAGRNHTTRRSAVSGV